MRQSAIAIVLLLSAATVLAQPRRDAPAATTGTATISGLVITDEPQPRPVRRGGGGAGPATPRGGRSAARAGPRARRNWVQAG
jgi:hypothetical protein